MGCRKLDWVGFSIPKLLFWVFLFLSVMVFQYTLGILPVKALTKVSEVLSNPERPTELKQLDILHQTEAVLTFFSVQPGMRLLEIGSTTDYFSKTLAEIIGERGQLYILPNSLLRPFSPGGESWVINQSQDTNSINPGQIPGPDVSTYKNISVLQQSPLAYQKNELEYQENSSSKNSLLNVKLVLMFYSVEDLYVNYKKHEREQWLKNLWYLMAEGAVLGIVGHEASVEKAIDNENKIYKQKIINNLQMAGFVLSAQQDLPGYARAVHENDYLGRENKIDEKNTRNYLLRFYKPKVEPMDVQFESRW